MFIGDISKETLLLMYRTMWKIRTYEETVGKIYYEGKTPAFDIAAGPIPGELHLSSGQESAAVGICIHLRPDDVVVGTHRAHHFAIAKGVNLKKMTAEIFGKETGLSRGKGGHMHLFDANVNFSCSGIVGASFPQAVGAGIAAKMTKKDYVGVAFGGEGAANQGTFHESLNLASLWKLPVIFVIEDNTWAISVAKDKSTAIAENSERARAYGIPGVNVDGQDVLDVYEVAKKAIERARKDLEIEKKKDSIIKFEKLLLEKKIITDKEVENIRKKIEEEVEEVIEFARKGPYPKPEEALENVFIGGN